MLYYYVNWSGGYGHATLALPSDSSTSLEPARIKMRGILEPPFGDGSWFSATQNDFVTSSPSATYDFTSHMRVVSGYYYYIIRRSLSHFYRVVWPSEKSERPTVHEYWLEPLDDGVLSCHRDCLLPNGVKISLGHTEAAIAAGEPSKTKTSVYRSKAEFQLAPAPWVWKNDELETFKTITEFDIFPASVASKFSAAYVDAINRTPQVCANSLANVIDAAGAVASSIRILRDPLKGLAKASKDILDPRNLWLTYRYVFKTTQSDIAEYREVSQRIGDLLSADTSAVSVDGWFADETGSYHAKVVLAYEDVVPHTFHDLQAAAGFDLTPLVVWDLIPYSFIVDWAIPVSRNLEYLERLHRTSEMVPIEIWFTYKSSYDGQSQCYRVRGRRLVVPPIWSEYSTSDRVYAMRVADTISLFS